MNKKKFICFIFSGVFILIFWIYFSIIDYINFISYFKSCWFLFLLLTITILLKKYMLTSTIIFSMHLGLIVEYIIHLTHEHRSMTGAFYNVGILILGSILGFIMQFIFDVYKRTNKAKKH